MKKMIFMVAAATLLVACGDKPQTLGGAKQDAPAFSGTGKPYANTGWKSGDKASWESQLKARAQNSQNEYSKTN